MRQVGGNINRPAPRQFFEGHAEIHLEDQLLVVFEVNEKRESTEAGEFFAKEPHVFTGGPGVDNLRPAAIRENGRPFAIDPIESMHGVILFAEAGAAV